MIFLFLLLFFIFFFFNDTATTEIYTLSLHDALPILPVDGSTADAGQNWSAFFLTGPIGPRQTGLNERSKTATATSWVRSAPLTPYVTKTRLRPSVTVGFGPRHFTVCCGRTNLPKMR